MPSGNPILGRLAKVDRRLDDHERRITATEAELREVNQDIADLGGYTDAKYAREGRWQ